MDEEQDDRLPAPFVLRIRGLCPHSPIHRQRQQQHAVAGCSHHVDSESSPRRWHHHSCGAKESAEKQSRLSDVHAAAEAASATANSTGVLGAGQESVQCKPDRQAGQSFL